MATWMEFSQRSPELAAFGRERYGAQVAYLGTIRADGGPRIHPVTPIVGDELYLFMEPTSPKGRDLERDGRYTLHCAVANMAGGEGEFYVRGVARRVTSPEERAAAIAASPYSPADRYILFALSVDFAFSNVYGDEGSRVTRWEPEQA